VYSLLVVRSVIRAIEAFEAPLAMVHEMTSAWRLKLELVAADKAALGGGRGRLGARA
jgi:hypothetical protein